MGVAIPIEKNLILNKRILAKNRPNIGAVKIFDLQADVSNCYMYFTHCQSKILLYDISRLTNSKCQLVLEKYLL